MSAKLDLNHRQTAALLAFFVFVLLFVTAPKIGLTWDEPDYIAASESYMKWFSLLFTHPGEAVGEEAITAYWSVNSEHPPLDKIWSGLFWELTRTVTDDLTAHRVGNMLLTAVMAGLLFLWMSETYGRLAGYASAAALLTMPRFFFHSHLAALDVPAAVSVFMVTFAFWQLRDHKDWMWGLLLGLIWGLALAVKVNAAFVPAPLLLWWLIFRRDLKNAIRLFLMGFTAAPVFQYAWPWLYYHTSERLAEYILFITTEHWEIGQYYLGEFHLPSPWHFGFVMIWAVLPLSLTVLYFTGIIRSGTGQRDNGLGWLLFFSALTPVLAITFGGSMVYDNERLMMGAFPFLAALAGVGFDWIVACWKTFAGRWKQSSVSVSGIVILAALAFLPQAATMVRLYPHYLSYYGESVGGLKGADKMGLEVTYWCESFSLALPYLNERAQPGDRVWSDPWSHNVLIYYQMHGRLRDDLVILAPADVESILGAEAPRPRNIPMDQADWFIFQNRRSSLGYEGDDNMIIWILKGKEVVYEYRFDGVPIMRLYQQ
ncbi:MAG: glycosyltransferase family 39 protein [Anaerolineales bacterium]|nr:glycosyltransferase family 39 protein [Anaerolineales bacterium]